jgi:hypothetical protein
VATGTTVSACEKTYIQMLDEKGLGEEIVLPQSEIMGTVAEIRTAVLVGTSYYFLRLEGDSVFYSINAAEHRDVITLNVGDMVTIEHEIPSEGTSPSILDGYSLTIYPVIGSVDGPTAKLGFTVDGEEVPTIEAGAEVPFQFQTFPGHIAVVP